MIIVGSVAAAQWGLSRRDPIDFDIWVPEGQSSLYESMKDMHEELNLKYVEVQEVPMHIYDMVEVDLAGIPSKDALYTIKCSHFGWDIKWDKTKADILFMKSKGCKLIPELYEALKQHWQNEHGDKSFLSLDKSKDEFFNDFVEYNYDHDYLHELVAYPEAPMYTHCLKDGHEVLIDEAKFRAMPFEDQVRMFREEITVIACERWLLTSKCRGKVSWMKAYRMALRKTVTALTKNWATEFLVLNIEEFVQPDYSYFKHLLETLNLEEIMSNVDISIFEAIRDKYEPGMDINTFVFGLADGDMDDFTYGCDAESPASNGRKWDDPELKEEWRLYFDQVNDAKEKMISQLGYEHIQQEGGGEGGTEHCQGVFRLQGKLYSAVYSYYSHHGYDYDYIADTLREVEPVQKTITVYE